MARRICTTFDRCHGQFQWIIGLAMPLPAGTRIGPHEIVAKIGEGGMGEVYRARDTRLQRDVAVKVLPAGVAADPDRRARFEREAQAVAALSHPNILAIHDTGTHDGQLYMVTELLTGESLRATLAPGPLPIKKAIEIAMKIARGLAAAHDKGLVHRDLKPENVFVLADGQVKVLDFGLAKALAPEPTSTADTATTMAAATNPGVVLGTVGYMAPEQVRGQPIDARTDLFALGAVLYEMLTGHRAFRAGTAADTMSAIVRDDPPDMTTTRADLSPGLERIVRHCLEKNPVERFQSARDVAFALDALTGTAASAAPRVHSPARHGLARTALTAAAGFVLAVLAVAATRWFSPAGPPAEDWSGVELGGPEVAWGPRISPNGQMLAFSVMVNGVSQVGVMPPGSGHWIPLTKGASTGYVDDLCWSADGNSIYFSRWSDVPVGVFSVPAIGGQERLILEDAGAPNALPDGSLLVVRVSGQREHLFRYWPDGGRMQDFPIVPSDDDGVRVFRDGREAVVVGTLATDASERAHLYAVDLSSGQARRLIAGDDSAVLASSVAIGADDQSVIVAIAAGDLWRVVSIPRSGTHPPRTLFTLTHATQFAVAPDGSIYLDQWEYPASVWQFPAVGGRADRIATLRSRSASGGLGVTGMNFATRLSGGRLVVPQSFAGRVRLVVLSPGKNAEPLVTTNDETAGPITPVGSSELAFLVGPSPRRTIAIATTSNGRATITARVPFDKGEIVSLAAPPDGQTLFVGAEDVIWSVPRTGGEPKRIRAGTSAAVGPSGRGLLVQVREATRMRLFELPFNGDPEREIVLKGPDYPSVFDPLNSGAISRDGRLLAAVGLKDNWFFPPGILDLATGRMTRINIDHVGDYHFFLWTEDGEVIAGAHDVRSTLWRFRPKSGIAQAGT